MEKDDIDETAIDRFMEHIVHSRSIDRNVYAVPPAIQILETIGPIIDRLDTLSTLSILQIYVILLSLFAAVVVFYYLLSLLLL